MKPLKFLLWLYVLVFLALPIVILIPGFSGFNLRVFDRSFLLALKNSFFIASATALLSMVIGFFLALAVGKTAIKKRGAWAILLSLPLFFLPYQFALGWSSLLPPGPLTHLFFSPFGVVFVLSGCFYPVVLWLVLVGLYSISPQEEEAALLFSPPSVVFRKITLPRVLPSLLAGGLLVFLLSLSEMGVATYLGVNVLPTQILTQFSAFYNFKTAFAYCLPLLFIGIVIFALEAGFLRRKLHWREDLSLAPGLVFPSNFAVSALLAFVFALFFLLPMASLLKEGLSYLPSALRWGGKSLLLSLVYSIFAALVVLLWAVPSAFSGKGTEKVGFSYFSLLAFLLPPPALGIGLIYMWGKVPLPVYGTGLLLVFGLAARYSFIAFKVLENSFRNLDPSPMEAAYLCGASPTRVFFRITLPSLKKWVILSFVLIFIFSLNDLNLSTMLYPPGGEPLVVRIYTLSVNSPIGVLSALSLANSFLVIISLIVLFSWRKG